MGAVEVCPAGLQGLEGLVVGHDFNQLWCRMIVRFSWYEEISTIGKVAYSFLE